MRKREAIALAQTLTDEQAATEAFEDLCGGVNKAQRLLQLYKNSYPSGTEYDRLMGRGKTKEEVFARKAKQAGFTDEQIDALLDLQ